MTVVPRTTYVVRCQSLQLTNHADAMDLQHVLVLVFLTIILQFKISFIVQNNITVLRQ